MKRRFAVYVLAFLVLATGARQPELLSAQAGECSLAGATVRVTATTTVGEGYEGGDAPIFEPAYTVEIVEPSDREGETQNVVSVTERPGGIPGSGSILEPTSLEVGETYLIRACWAGEAGFDYSLVEAQEPAQLEPKVEWKIVGLECESNNRWELNSSMEFKEQVGTLQRFTNTDTVSGEQTPQSTWYDDWDPVTRTKKQTWVEEGGELKEHEDFSSVPEYLPLNQEIKIGDSIVLNGNSFSVQDQIQWATPMDRTGGESRMAWVLVNEEDISFPDSVTLAADFELKYDVELGLLVAYARTEELYSQPEADASATPTESSSQGAFLGYRLKSLNITYPDLGGMRVIYEPGQEACNRLARERPRPSEQDSDGDGIVDSDDNCPSNANRGQYDLDEDGVGDVCDPEDVVVDSGWEYDDAYPDEADIVGGGLQYDGTTLTFTIKLRNMPAEPESPLYGVYLDTDHSPDTGLKLGGIGADHALHIQLIDDHGEDVWFCSFSTWAERNTTRGSPCPDGAVSDHTLRLSTLASDLGGLDWKLNFAFYATGESFPLTADAVSIYDLMPDIGSHFSFIRSEQVLPESPLDVWFAAPDEMLAYGKNFYVIFHVDGHAYMPIASATIDLWSRDDGTTTTLVSTDSEETNCFGFNFKDVPELQQCTSDFFRPWREGGSVNQVFVFDTNDYDDGEYLLRAQVEDSAGVISQAEHGVHIDNVNDPPELTFRYPAAGSTVGNGVNAFFTWEDDDLLDAADFDHFQWLKEDMQGLDPQKPDRDDVAQPELKIVFEGEPMQPLGTRGWYDPETGTSTEITESTRDLPDLDPDLGWGYHFFIPYMSTSRETGEDTFVEDTHHGDEGTIVAELQDSAGNTGTAEVKVKIDQCEEHTSLLACTDSDGDGLTADEDCDDTRPQLPPYKRGGDWDGDDITNCDDLCPTVEGYPEYDGCPNAIGQYDGQAQGLCAPVWTALGGGSCTIRNPDEYAGDGECAAAAGLECGVEAASEVCPGPGCAVEVYDLSRELVCDVFQNAVVAFRESKWEKLGTACAHLILVGIDAADNVALPLKVVSLGVGCWNQNYEALDVAVESMLKEAFKLVQRKISGTFSWVHSPVELHAYDSEGRHVGPDANGDLESEIPGAFYVGSDHLKIVWLPDATEAYTLEAEGTDSGTFSLTSMRSDEQGALTTEYTDVEVSPATTASVALSRDSDLVLEVDTDGDGQTDEALMPSAVEMDRDADGIPDSLDHCSGTPAGTEIDDYGCEAGAFRDPNARGGREIALYTTAGQMPLGVAEDWEGDVVWGSEGDVTIVDDPKARYDKVAKLSVTGYGHGEETATLSQALEVPPGADIVAIPLATALNGGATETDSEAGVEIRVSGDRDVSTTFSHLWETGVGASYVLAFADVSEFRGEEAELSVVLHQPDVCAGSECTQDIDLYLGDLSFASLPDLCTTEADGGHSLFDYYEDPTPKTVDECADAQPFYFQEVEYDATNAYGPGSDTHSIDFDLPEGATVDRVGLYYGPTITRFVVNGEEIDAEAVYKVFPVRSSTYVAVDAPLKYGLVNDTTALLDAYLAEGENTMLVETEAEKDFEERPFYFYARFKVPSGPLGAQPIAAEVQEGDGGGIGWWVPTVAAVAAVAAALALGWLVYRRRRA